MKGVIIVVSTLLLSAIYASYFFRYGDIYQVYQSVGYRAVRMQSCKSTVVLINNFPVSDYSKKKLWLKNEKLLIGKWKALESECDSVHFIKNKTERASHPAENKYWVDDFQYCLDGVLGDDKCISKDEQLFVVQLRAMALKDKVISEYKGKPIYLHFGSASNQ